MIQYARYGRLLERGGAPDPFADRVSVLSGQERAGDFVLYWMQSSRRIHQNLALEYALRLANERNLPLLVYESLRPDYPGANDRIHQFVLQGVRANAADAARRGLRYLFFLPRTPAEARGALRRLSERAAALVTDEYPTFIFPAQTRRFAERNTDLRVITVDGNGILPMRAPGREMYSAKILRDIARKRLEDYWCVIDEAQPKRPRYGKRLPLPHWNGRGVTSAVASCSIDHSVKGVATEGGRTAGLTLLDSFIREGLPRYDESNRNPRRSSRLSPYLHFGYLGAHEVALRVLHSGAPAAQTDAYLEQLIIRRELSFNLCFYRQDHASLAALPDWARKTLHAHARDRRKPLYTFEQMEKGETGDAVWNLSQRELLQTGTIHNYLRMIWGKRIIEWTRTIEDAYRFMIEQHDRYAIDGRDPNTHAGVLWCFGKHDRPWAERPILGKVRYMSSEAAARKVDLEAIRARLDSA